MPSYRYAFRNICKTHYYLDATKIKMINKGNIHTRSSSTSLVIRKILTATMRYSVHPPEQLNWNSRYQVLLTRMGVNGALTHCWGSVRWYSHTHTEDS